MKEKKNSQSRLLYLAKLSFINEGERMNFLDKQKWSDLITFRPALEEMLKRVLAKVNWCQFVAWEHIKIYNTLVKAVMSYLIQLYVCDSMVTIYVEHYFSEDQSEEIATNTFSSPNGTITFKAQANICHALIRIWFKKWNINLLASSGGRNATTDYLEIENLSFRHSL